MREERMVERGGKDLWGERGRAALGEEKEEAQSAKCNQSLIRGRGIVEDQILSANTVFRSAMPAS